MTLAEFHAALDGFLAAQGGGGDAPDDAEFLAVLAEEMAAGRA